MAAAGALRLPCIRLERDCSEGGAGRLVRAVIERPDQPDVELPPFAGISYTAGAEDGFMGTASIAWHGTRFRIVEVSDDA